MAKLNPTVQRYPRAMRDDCTRCVDPFSGPYARPRFFRYHKWATAITLVCAIAGTLAMISGALAS